jgi:hypothetical protein
MDAFRLWVFAILAAVGLFCWTMLAYGRWIGGVHVRRRDRQRYAEEQRLLATGELPVTWTKTYQTIAERDSDMTRMLGLGYRSEHLLTDPATGQSQVAWVRHYAPEANQGVLASDG